jgi:hypothetical protein
MEFIPWTFNQKEYTPGYKRTLEQVGPTSLYLYDIVRSKYISLPVIPNSVSASYTAALKQLSSFGILHPINYYIGGSAKTISFAVDVHEDLVMDYTGRENTERNNLYHMLDILKAMSEPREDNGRLEPPHVYMQLGNQFAGKGHIETTISLATPYRDNRYVLANINITFTFHDSFKNSELEIVSEEPGSLKIGLGVSDLERLGATEENFENFFKENFGIDAILRRTLADSKLYNLAHRYITLYTYDSNSDRVKKMKQRFDNLDDYILQGNLSAIAALVGAPAPITEETMDVGHADMAAPFALIKGLATFKVIMTGNYYTEQTKQNLLALQTEISIAKAQYRAFRDRYLAVSYGGSYSDLKDHEGDHEEFRDSIDSGYETLLNMINTQLKFYDFSESEE